MTDRPHAHEGGRRRLLELYAGEIELDVHTNRRLVECSALTRRLLGQPPADGGAAPQPPPGMLRAFTAAGLPVPPGVTTHR